MLISDIVGQVAMPSKNNGHCTCARPEQQMQDMDRATSNQFPCLESYPIYLLRFNESFKILSKTRCRSMLIKFASSRQLCAYALLRRPAPPPSNVKILKQYQKMHACPFRCLVNFYMVISASCISPCSGGTQFQSLDCSCIINYLII